MKFKNTYRIESARLPHWDYSHPGMYFITICTKNFIEWFGSVNNDKMVLNGMGEIAFEEWIKTGELRDNIELGEFVVMPNHVHGIIGIISKIDEVGTRRAVSLRENKNKFGPLKKGSLSSIIGSYKSAVTKSIRKSHNPNFAWQPRFYDHVIRNNNALEKIQNYILLNPENWNRDKNNLNDNRNFISTL